jgi:signal recognition particle receptor subunit beta
VVDSNDTERIDLANAEIHKLLAADELRDACVLILANKQDLRNSLSPAELMEKLQLDKMRFRESYVQGCVATSGEGLYEGLDWLSKTLTKRNA